MDEPFSNINRNNFHHASDLDFNKNYHNFQQSVIVSLKIVGENLEKFGVSVCPSFELVNSSQLKSTQVIIENFYGFHLGRL